MLSGTIPAVSQKGWTNGGKTEKKENCFPGKITELIYDGAFTKLLIKSDKKIIKALLSGNDKLYNIGDEIYLYWTIEDAIIIEDSKKISINTATKEELMKLSGIGESKANAIIKFREENGNFTKIEDIMNVSGIGESAFEKIKDDICL